MCIKHAIFGTNLGECILFDDCHRYVGLHSGRKVELFFLFVVVLFCLFVFNILFLLLECRLLSGMSKTLILEKPGGAASFTLFLDKDNLKGYLQVYITFCSSSSCLKSRQWFIPKIRVGRMKYIADIFKLRKKAYVDPKIH